MVLSCNITEVLRTTIFKSVNDERAPATLMIILFLDPRLESSGLLWWWSFGGCATRGSCLLASFEIEEACHYQINQIKYQEELVLIRDSDLG